MDYFCFFFFQAEDGIRDVAVTGVQTCALPICLDLGILMSRFTTDGRYPPRHHRSEPDAAPRLARLARLSLEVSNPHLNQAWPISLIAAHKFVLVAMADHACDICGLTWPGIRRLMRETGLYERTI